MNLLYAAFLGVLQGLTEFLPVSSSAHLALAEHFFCIEKASLTFDVVLHLATMVAVIGYFRHDLWNLTLALFGIYGNGRGPRERTMALYICFATVPAVVGGLLLEDYAEGILRSPILIACTLSVAGLVLLWSEKVGRKERSLDSLSIKDAMIIGFCQTMALVPGVSRSGATITGGLFLGLKRESATRFSFLLSTPIVMGAGSYKFLKLLRGPGLEAGQPMFFLVGFIASAVSGYFVISFLMKFVETKSLAVFAYYRFFLSALVVIAVSFIY